MKSFLPVSSSQLLNHLNMKPFTCLYFLLIKAKAVMLKSIMMSVGKVDLFNDSTSFAGKTNQPIYANISIAIFDITNIFVI